MKVDRAQLVNVDLARDVRIESCHQIEGAARGAAWHAVRSCALKPAARCRQPPRYSNRAPAALAAVPHAFLIRRCRRDPVGTTVWSPEVWSGMHDMKCTLTVPVPLSVSLAGGPIDIGYPCGAVWCESDAQTDPRTGHLTSPGVAAF